MSEVYDDDHHSDEASGEDMKESGQTTGEWIKQYLTSFNVCNPKIGTFPLGAGQGCWPYGNDKLVKNLHNVPWSHSEFGFES